MVNLYIWLTTLSCYGSSPLPLVLIGKDSVLNILYHKWGFACQERVLKTFPGPGYLHPEDRVAWLRQSVVSLYIWLTILLCYGSIPFNLGLIESDGGLITLCHNCRLACQYGVLKTIPGLGYLSSEDGVILLWHSLVCLYVWLKILWCYDSIALALGLIGRDGGLIIICDSCGDPCQQRILKTFACPSYLHCEDGVVWLWHSLGKLYIWLTSFSSYSSIPLASGLIERDGVFRSLYHSCEFAWQNRVLKIFPGPGYLLSKDRVIRLWHWLINFYIWLTIWSCYGSIPLALELIGMDGNLSTLCHSCGFACQ